MWTFGGGGRDDSPVRQWSGGALDAGRSPEAPATPTTGGDAGWRGGGGGAPAGGHGFVEIGEDEEPPAEGLPPASSEHERDPPAWIPAQQQPAPAAASLHDAAGGDPRGSPPSASASSPPADAPPQLNRLAPTSPGSVHVSVAAPGSSDGRASPDSSGPSSAQRERSFSQRVRRTSVENVFLEFARTSSLMVSRGVSGLRGDNASEGEAEAEANEYAPAGQNTLDDHLKLRAVEKDMSSLNILQFSATMECAMRTDMNRFTLLEECRKSFPLDSSEGRRPGRRRKQSAASLGAALQLRDIRCLQGVSEPALLVRRGAIVVSLDPIKAIVTCDRCFVVIPDGADELLVPLMKRLREGNKDLTVEMPFEFVALEALLVTLVNSHARDVKRRLQDSRALLRSLKSGITNTMLNRILTLKKAIDEMYEAVIGCHETLEEVQGDDDLMGLMYLTAQKEGRRNHKNTHHSVMQAELLLDAYAIDFLSMAKQLSLMSKEIDATEDFLKFKLDKARNRLITLDVMFGMVAMWLTATAVIGGYFGMNLPNGAYADGTVPPGGDYVPPTSGDAYAGPFGEYQGPSFQFFYSSVLTSAITLVGILATWGLLRYCGLTRS